MSHREYSQEITLRAIESGLEKNLNSLKITSLKNMKKFKNLTFTNKLKKNYLVTVKRNSRTPTTRTTKTRIRAESFFDNT